MIKDALVYISSLLSVQVILVTWPSATLDTMQTLYINSLPPILDLHLKQFLYDASDTTISSTSLGWYVQHTCFTHTLCPHVYRHVKTYRYHSQTTQKGRTTHHNVLCHHLFDVGITECQQQTFHPRGRPACHTNHSE